MPPRLSPLPPLPNDSMDIPGVPPSTVLIPRLEGTFGFTAPKSADVAPLPTLSIDSFDGAIQPAGSTDDAVIADESAPVLAPLPLPERKRTAELVELDASLFLLELFEDAEIAASGKNAVPTVVNGLSIQPWISERPAAPNTTAPLPWPADGVMPTPTITPGPVMSKWSSEPLPTRPANSRPRRLMVGNSDSEIRPIE
jgi:hypothetical protein